MASSSAAATKSSAAASSSATSSSSGGAATAASAANTTRNRGPYQIWVHDITAFGGADLVLSKDAFPHVTGDGELVEIRDQNDNAVVIRVDTPPILLKGNMQISISKRISTQFNLAPRQVVSVSVLDANDKEKITLESVELSFKDQYVGMRRSIAIELDRSSSRTCECEMCDANACECRTVRCRSRGSVPHEQRTRGYVCVHGHASDLRQHSSQGAVVASSRAIGTPLALSCLVVDASSRYSSSTTSPQCV